MRLHALVRIYFPPKCTMGKDAKNVSEKLADMLCTAETVVLLDADFNDHSVEMYRSLLGNRPITVWDVPAIGNPDIKCIFQTPNMNMEAIYRAMDRNEHVFVMCDSATQAQAVEKSITDMFPQAKGLCIYKDSKDGVEQHALLANINEERKSMIF